MGIPRASSPPPQPPSGLFPASPAEEGGRSGGGDQTGCLEDSDQRARPVHPQGGEVRASGRRLLAHRPAHLALQAKSTPAIATENQDFDVHEDLRELYGDLVSAEELARLDAQPNCFNFSERVSQTLLPQTKVLPLRSTFAEDEVDLQELLPAAKVVERMVNQNVQDEVVQDYKYWEDASDEFHPLEGSLLPLWKFTCDASRVCLVTDVCWSFLCDDLFAAGYATEGDWEAEDEGMVCLYTLKNPGVGERLVPVPRGVTSIHLHPTRPGVLVAGRTDGEVMVVSFRGAGAPRVLTSSAATGKHLQPVGQVRWEDHDRGEIPTFYSVSTDGRLTHWKVNQSFLQPFDVIDFCEVSLWPPSHDPTPIRFPERPRQSCEPPPTTGRGAIEGRGTCLALHPFRRDLLLLGTDTGAVFRLHTHNTIHALTRFSAHAMQVTALMWNRHHKQVFASCGFDWFVKIWDETHPLPLVTHDLGAPVTAVTWAFHSSSVLAAATEDGRVHVFDFFERKCGPLCVHRVQRRRKVAPACLAFNPFHPLLLVGGERGYLMASKLSPNLRKPFREAKEEDERTVAEKELYKMDRLIATSK
ncbi:dynein intermediate chain 2, ciliary-like [Penaeus chinensis]|uniref:dynein intermediate chain 2, ciliary-like n=1 Tax=Penaeus chinensis TaxID=139456 RepID=UPI001FB62B38|nr:dynein intermediate chain 2, ciliary-like [Penaeus chinensis]